jgi:hypothetical protein
MVGAPLATVYRRDWEGDRIVESTHGNPGGRISTAVWPISAELVLALDDHLGLPVDSYVNGSQTWLTEIDDTTLEWRLHPVAGYRVPRPLSHYDIWEAVVDGLRAGTDPYALRLGDEVRPLTSLWDGLECFAAYGDDLEPQRLGALATSLLTIAPAGVGQVDHDAIGDEWEAKRGNVSIVALLLEQLSH